MCQPERFYAQSWSFRGQGKVVDWDCWNQFKVRAFHTNDRCCSVDDDMKVHASFTEHLKNYWIYWNFSAKIQWWDIHLKLQSFQRLELLIWSNWWLILKICWLSGCCENLWCSLRVSLCIWQLQDEWCSLHHFWLGILCAVHRCQGRGTCDALPNDKKR